MKKLISTFILNYIFSLTYSQNFLNSSIVRVNGNANSSMAIQFKSNDKCLDIQNGIAVLNGKRVDGIFSLDCIIDENRKKLGLKFYPNPVYNIAKIQFLQKPAVEEQFSLTIWNTLGNKIFVKNESGSNLFRGIQLNTSFLPAGPYLFVISSHKYLDAIKFIKKD